MNNDPHNFSRPKRKYFDKGQKAKSFTVAFELSKMFLLKRFWIMFYIANVVGIFPCKRKTIEGQDYLRPKNKILQFAKYLVFVTGFFVAPSIVMKLIYKITMSDLMSIGANTQTNQIVIISYWTVFALTHISSVFSLYKINHDLCQLQDFIADNIPKLPSEQFPYTLGAILWVPAGFLTALFFPIGFAQSLADSHNLNNLDFFIVYTMLYLMIFVLVLPNAILIFILIEICKLVHRWVQNLREFHDEVGVPHQFQFLGRIETFCGQWKNIKTFLSFPIFQLFSLSIIMAIIVSYRSFDFLITSDFSSANLTIQALGFFILSTVTTYSFIFVNLYSQKIGDQVRDLKENIQDQCILSLDLEKSEELIVMKNLILCHLTRWENFDGYGFFVLGKPFLTGILANFITYIIVLIQFQLTLQDPE